MARRIPAIKYCNLDQATADAWRALKQANKNGDHNEFLFRYGDLLCRLEFNDGGRLVPKTLSHDRMRYRLSERQVASWPVLRNGVQVEGKAAPGDVVSNVLATPNPPLPIVRRIMEVPVMAPDGTVHAKAGYSDKSKVFLHPQDGLVVPPIKSAPTKREVKRARDLILREVFGDFPFVGKAEKAHALCMLIQPFVRDLISGVTPLYLVESPTPGTGKGLLVDVACYPTMGGPTEVMSEPPDEAEWRKQITACLLKSPPIIFIDNVKDSLRSAALAAALTTPVWSDRRLSKSEQLSLPNLSMWIAAGNNPGMSKEIQRRSVRIRQDAKVEHPEDRTDFRHPDLRGWVRDHRGKLIWAALTLARAWVVEGSPPGTQRLGSFESWSEVMGGILDVAGVSGFLSNQEVFREHAQSENTGMYEFLSAWRAQYGPAPVGAKDLANRSRDLIGQHLGIDASESSANISIGIKLRQHRDRRYGDLMLVSEGQPHGVSKWSVQEVEDDNG